MSRSLLLAVFPTSSVFFLPTTSLPASPSTMHLHASYCSGNCETSWKIQISEVFLELSLSIYDWHETGNLGVL